MSGTTELTVSTLHKIHETLIRLENKTSTDKLAEQEAESKRNLGEAEQRIHEAERRAQEAERRFREASAQVTISQEVPVQEVPNVAALIQAACADAACVERELKRETNASAAATAIKFTETLGVRTDAGCPKQESKDKGAPKPDPKKSERKSKPSRRKRPNRDLSPDSSDPSSDSDEDVSYSSSSSTSSGEEARSSTKRPSKAKVGSTLLTVRPYVNPNALEKFDEKAPLDGRRP
ncbi:unnamed protein product [Phytophthora fragariaefolia]|uniref:Unnamed protein product n=1 Tax=Phytophthora fragariaefolia TaxID=1490495 RepID=A0A9W7D2L4_9STRA|nr:unnamed protein product [Phytophthora fragariaefolia]